VKPGITYGATDELGYNVAKIGQRHDLQATILNQLGIDTRTDLQLQGRYSASPMCMARW